MRVTLAVPMAVLLSCTPSGGPQLALSAKPNRINNRGQLTDLTVTATLANGSPGTGDVKFTSTTGSLKNSETWTLSNGTVTIGFSCDVSQDPGCINTARIIAEWSVSGTPVTAETRVTLESSGDGGTGGGGGGPGSSGDGGRRDAGPDPNDSLCYLPDISGCWHFDENAGSIAYDSSGHEHHATNTRMLRWDAGYDGGGYSVHLEGQDALSTSTDPELELGTKFTVQLWARPTSLNPGMFLVSKQFSWGVSHDTSGFDMCFNVSTSMGLQQLCSTGGQLNTEVWKKITATWDGTAIRLYVNSLPYGPLTLMGTPSTGLGVLAVGANGTNIRYVGLIDDLRIMHGVYPP